MTQWILGRRLLVKAHISAAGIGNESRRCGRVLPRPSITSHLFCSCRSSRRRHLGSGSHPKVAQQAATHHHFLLARAPTARQCLLVCACVCACVHVHLLTPAESSRCRWADGPAAPLALVRVVQSEMKGGHVAPKTHLIILLRFETYL